jgi:hypothetical protein
MFRLTTAIVLLVGFSVVRFHPAWAQELSSNRPSTMTHGVGSFAVGSASASAHVAALRVKFTPRVPRLHSRLTVTVSGLHRGEGLRFVFSRIPRTDAFGGPVGTFYANARGIVHFTYPAFLYKQEIGRWRMIGYRADGTTAVNKIFSVTG